MLSDYKAVAYIYSTFITVSMGKYCKYFRNRVGHTDKLKCLSSVNAIFSHGISYAERFKMTTSIIKSKILNSENVLLFATVGCNCLCRAVGLVCCYLYCKIWSANSIFSRCFQ